MRFEEHEYEGNTFFRSIGSDLEEYAVALDMFPAMTPEDRAIIFAAIEEAPEERPDTWDMNERYFDSPAYRTWKDAAQVPLSNTRETRWAVDLAEASGFASIVTREDILAALHRGKMLVDG